MKAEEEPRKIQPKRMTRAVVRMREFRGTPREGWTFAKVREKGRPRSRANAQVMREDVVIMPVVAKRRQIRGKRRRTVAPVGWGLVVGSGRSWWGGVVLCLPALLPVAM